MTPYDLRARCSQYFTDGDLIECGVTWGRGGVADLPASEATWAGIARLAEVILDALPHWDSE